MRIVFLGTPDFAVASLKALLDSDHDIVGVITTPDRKGGRGLKRIIESDIKKFALTHNLRLLQPTNLKSEKFVEELRALQADVQVVVAFRMLPEIVWNMPKHGTYNLHGSLLPRYRGAAPINWALINGDEYTGVTTFKLKHKIDTGHIAYQKKIPIHKSDDLVTLYDRMKNAGAQLVVKTIDDLASGTLYLQEQNEGKVTAAPKIFHQDCQLQAAKTPEKLYNRIRGLSPYPTAWNLLGEKKLKIFKASYSYEISSLNNGQWYSNGKNWLRWKCNNGYIEPEVLQWEGRKKMSIQDFLNGFNIKANNLPFLILD